MDNLTALTGLSQPLQLSHLQLWISTPSSKIPRAQPPGDKKGIYTCQKQGVKIRKIRHLSPKPLSVEVCISRDLAGRHGPFLGLCLGLAVSVPRLSLGGVSRRVSGVPHGVFIRSPVNNAVFLQLSPSRGGAFFTLIAVKPQMSACNCKHSAEKLSKISHNSEEFLTFFLFF